MDKPVRQEAAPGFTAPPLSEKEINVIVFGVLLSMLLAALDQTIVAPAMPTMGHALGHADYLPWVVTAYLLSAPRCRRSMARSRIFMAAGRSSMWLS